MFVNHKSSKEHYNKSYDYENNNNIHAKTQNSVEKCEKVSKPFKPRDSLKTYSMVQWELLLANENYQFWHNEI